MGSTRFVTSYSPAVLLLFVGVGAGVGLLGGQLWSGPQERWSASEIDGIPIHIWNDEPSAEDLGMASDLLAQLDTVIIQAIADSASSGAALAIGRSGGIVRLRGYGNLDWGAESEPVTPESMYDLASLTKVVGTTSAIMLLVRDGDVNLDAPVVDYLPWWAGGEPQKATVTLRDLLLHRAGLPPFRRWFTELEGKEAYQEAIASEPLEFEPGTATSYSDIGFMSLAFVVEAVSGLPVDEFLEARVWRPLRMTSTGYNPPASELSRIAPTEIDTVFRSGKVHGEVHDENAFAMGGVAGHAGLFSTVEDLAAFAHMLMGGETTLSCFPSETCDGGTLGPLFPTAVRTEFTRRYDEESSRALGWDTPSGRSSAGAYFGTSAFGHTGFTGTSIWMDPELDLYVVLLTNRVNPTRENTKHVPLRRRVHDTAAQSLIDRVVTRREQR